MKKQTTIYAFVAILFIAIALVGCAGSRYGCPSHSGKNYKVGY